jgi:hypothetical protein
VLLAVLLLAAALCARPAAGAPTKWTFLIYMIADNNLECFALDDMAVRAGPSSTTNSDDMPATVSCMHACTPACPHD